MPGTIQDLEAELLEIRKSPVAYFGSDIDGVLRKLHLSAHPDKFQDSDKERAAQLFDLFSSEAEKARNPVSIKGYPLESLIASGDVSDVYRSGRHIVKVSRVPGAEDMLAHEAKILREFDDPVYGSYVPKVVEAFRAKDKFLKHVTVFEAMENSYTMEQLLAKFPTGVDARHVGWMYNRMLEILGAIHMKSLCHNAVLPCHVLVLPADHGVVLLDWKQVGQGPLTSISGKYKTYYPPEVFEKKKTTPATDIYMATKCAAYVGGGLPALPRTMAGFFRSVLLEIPRMRPQDAWALRDEFAVCLRDLYGKPKFVELEVG